MFSSCLERYHTLNKIRAQVVGATGYGGLGIIEQLIRHPGIEITSLLAQTDVAKPLSSFFPHLYTICDTVVQKIAPEIVGQDADVVLFATPDRVAMQYAPALLERNIRVLDYSGDFRFAEIAAYNSYAERQPTAAGQAHLCPWLLPSSVYGVPELFREKIRQAQLVGNPGCFAIAMELALAPALINQLVDPLSIIVDGKTGVSGGGKKPSATYHFPERVENVTPYRVANHQHGVEAAEVMRMITGRRTGITFVPHVVPISRGIECTCYAQLSAPVDLDAIVALYKETYQGEKFIRILPGTSSPGPKAVHGSNLCDISLFMDKPNQRLVITSSIDNLLKGQAGTALQNLNLMFGFEEDCAINPVPLYP
jgi:N-acetyl-gamma-glutamyl-phosphate reductase